MKPKLKKILMNPDLPEEIRAEVWKLNREIEELKKNQLQNIFSRLEALERKVQQHLERF